jgi:uroporphyrin-III C-methyltransferase
MTRYAGFPGTVYLTGAGPSSAKLLTIRALEVMRAADIVFHDDLVSGEILELIPPRVAVHNVGKRCGAKTITQTAIQTLVIGAARSGQTVVRLKGGDPLIFGRAHEEIVALRENGIPFEIIPGVTAASAAAAVAQISLTDRQAASKLVFISNHQCTGKNARLRPNTFTDSTLAFYMPGGNFGGLQGELLENGLDSQMPCLLISRAGLPGQQVIRTTICGLTRLPRAAAPSLLIVGPSGAEACADLSVEIPHPHQLTADKEIVLDLAP